VKSRLRKLVLKVLFAYAILFPSSGLINEIEDYTSNAQPEDTDEHMFI
jgi:hypothetical protein|tara:strand:+ start:770 stop:913 length:144 start_codon:yes stop_codon:yes gene_type:complete